MPVGTPWTAPDRPQILLRGAVTLLPSQDRITRFWVGGMTTFGVCIFMANFLLGLHAKTYEVYGISVSPNLRNQFINLIQMLVKNAAMMCTSRHKQRHNLPSVPDLYLICT